jgi:hypothetical protein
MKQCVTVMLALILAGAAHAAFPAWPYVGTMTGPQSDACVLIVPGGDGPMLSAARQPDGAPIDGSIHVQLVDWLGVPYANFSRGDIWLEFAGSPLHLSSCPAQPNGYGYFTPDAHSDQNGWVHFANPLAGGGWTEGPVTVYINGTAALTIDDVEWPSIPLQVNSPDLSGDRHVNLIDVSLFAGDMLGGYHLRSDLHRDGVLNLTDITILAEFMGDRCP